MFLSLLFFCSDLVSFLVASSILRIGVYCAVSPGLSELCITQEVKAKVSPFFCKLVLFFIIWSLFSLAW